MHWCAIYVSHAQLHAWLHGKTIIIISWLTNCTPVFVLYVAENKKGWEISGLMYKTLFDSGVPERQKSLWGPAYMVDLIRYDGQFNSNFAPSSSAIKLNLVHSFEILPKSFMKNSVKCWEKIVPFHDIRNLPCIAIELERVKGVTKTLKFSLWLVLVPTFLNGVLLYYH